ncbi:DUF4114 domain-containing protein, partial [Baaleninema sp.]|uniref:DUF4114 domain-containing protein n=1 Tax=Baaleninema sp. TaxID=3101197 RepID=UPI003D04D19B
AEDETENEDTTDDVSATAETSNVTEDDASSEETVAAETTTEEEVEDDATEEVVAEDESSENDESSEETVAESQSTEEVVAEDESSEDNSPEEEDTVAEESESSTDDETSEEPVAENDTSEETVAEEDEELDEETVAEEDEEIDEEDEEILDETPSFELPAFNSGVFTVGESGEVGVDFLYDGGKYRGEVAIFSISGLEELEFSSLEDFFAEAANRAASGSEQGHIVISDPSEGARFNGSLEGGKDWNSGDYRGVKTFAMRAGDKFAVMLVPNGRVAEVVSNPEIGGAKQPLFSLSTANPDDEFHIGQIADVTGDGNTFVMEDIRADGNSDKDYNDLIFQVRGATGEAVYVGDVVDSDNDWRAKDMGKALLAYSEPYITPDPVQIDLTESVETDAEVTEGVDDTPVEDGSETAAEDSDESAVTDEETDSEVVDEEVTVDDADDSATSDAGDEPEGSSPVVEAPPEVELTDSVDDTGDSTTEPTGESDAVDVAEEPATDADESDTEVVEESEEDVTETVDAAEETQDSNSSEPIVLEDKFEFPEEDQPEIVVIESENSVAETESAVDGEGEVSGDEASSQTESEELVKAVNSNAQVRTETVNADEWVTALTEAVDNAKASNDSNAIVALNIALTEELDDGSVVPRTELTQSERAALTYARDNGVLVTLSAGDTAGEAPIINGVAAEFDNVVVVGAAEPANDATSVWKSYAATDSSATGVSLDLVADGRNGETVSTSVAASRVTGAISQVWAANPDLNYTQVVDILKRTATDLGEWNWDTETGSGLVNVVAAVHLAKVTKPQPYTVKPGARTIADNFIAQNPGGKSLPGDPTHPAVAPPGIPEHTVDSGANTLDAATALLPSPTQDIIDQVSANDPTDVFQVESRYIDGAELAVMSGEISVQYLSPSGAVLGSQTLSRGSQTLQLPDNAPEDVLVKIERVGQSPATYTLYGFESLAEEPFDIALEYDSPISASQQQIMQAAAKNVASLIGQGLPTAVVDGKLIDDLNIKISTADVDGAGGTQARTKIDFMRYGTLLPAQSLVQFDAADIAQLEQSGQLFDVVRHEFLHALGFGNLWEAKGLVDYAGTSLAQYNGKQAVKAFQESGGLTDAIALETEGAGSAGLHWNENLFGDELMSRDLNLDSDESGEAPISEVTIASLADLGYEVNLGAATADYQMSGIQSFDAEDLTPEQIEAFRQLAEMSLEESDAEADDEYVAPIMPEVDPDTVAPEIWAHATRFWKNGEYYDWVDYRIPPGDTLSHIALRYLGNAGYDYYAWIGDYNRVANYNEIGAGDVIKVPIHHPNYEWKQEQERLQREKELRERQEREEREQKEREERLARDKAEQERKAREEAERQAEAERLARELEEQERKLREERERRRRAEELRKEQERLRELERQREIARQKGKGGQDWFFATRLPEFGPKDPFETKLTGETVGNLVPDDYYRFTLSRNGRITAELKQLLADADLVLYDVRNRPIAYSMREGITDEQIITDLIPGTYMLRVNSPEGVTTDYDLVVKFQHKLSLTQTGFPEGWRDRVGGSGGGAKAPLFSDPRIMRIYDTALNNFAEPERAKANAKIAELQKEKRSYEQQMQALLDKMNAEQRAKVNKALDDARNSARSWVDGIANPIKNTVDSLGNGIKSKADSVANSLFNKINNIWDFNNGWIKDRKEDARKLIRRGRDAVKNAVNSAQTWLKGKLGDLQGRVKSAISTFFNVVKNAYRTGAEINQAIANAANQFRSAVDRVVSGANKLVGEFKGQVLSSVKWTKNLGVNVNKFGVKFEFNAYNQVVKPAVNAIAGGVSSTINGIGNSLKGITNWLEPRTQDAVAKIVNALLGDKTGHLWNKINGVDAKIAATRTGLEKAISAAKQHIVSVARQIEAFLSDPEERKRVLEALWKWGFKTIEDAYNFIITKRDEVRKEIEAEKEARRKAEEEARRKAEEEAREIEAWPNANRVIAYMADELANNSKSVEVEILKKLNLDFLENNKLLYQLLPVEARLNITWSKLLAYAIWAYKVKPGADWDHKSSVKERSEGEDWVIDDKTDRIYKYEAWSNMHYGYIGRIAGFTESELLNGAGLAQTLTNGLLRLPIGDFIKEWEKGILSTEGIKATVSLVSALHKVIYGSNPDADLFDPSSIDDPGDKKSVQDGLRLYKKYSVGISQDEFTGDLRSAESQLHKAYS